MDIIIPILGSLLIGILVNLISSQIYDTLPNVAAWLIIRAAGRLPAKNRDRYLTEWLGHADNCGGNLAKLLHGAGCIKASFIMHTVSVRTQGRLLIFLNVYWNECFVVVWPARYIPSHAPNTTQRRLSHYKNIIRLEIPYVIARKTSLFLCPEVVYGLDAFNLKWIKTILPQATIVPAPHILEYYNEIELVENEVSLGAELIHSNDSGAPSEGEL